VTDDAMIYPTVFPPIPDPYNYTHAQPRPQRPLPKPPSHVLYSPLSASASLAAFNAFHLCAFAMSFANFAALSSSAGNT
jgi:hypothetical protein